MSTAITTTKTPAIIGFVVFFVLLLITLGFNYQRYLIIKDQRTRELTNAANVAKEKIQASLQDALAATTALSVIEKKYNIHQSDFDEIAQKILDVNNRVTSLGLIRGEILTNVFPLKGYENYIGHNVFTDSLRKKEIMKAIALKKLYFTGPFVLKKGGIGIIGRLPMFENEKNIGFALAEIDFPLFLKNAGLESTQSSNYIFQLSKVNPNTNKVEYFLPHPELFTKDDNIGTAKVEEGDWTIYVRSAKSNILILLLPFTVLGLLLSITAGILGWHIAKQPIKLKELVDKQIGLIKKTENQYTTLFLQSSPIYIIDYKGNFIDANPAFCKLFEYSKEDLLKMNVQELMDPDELKNDPVAFDKIMKGDLVSRERKMQKKNGAILDMWTSAKKADDTQIIVIGIDFSDLRNAQKEIALSESNFRSAFEYSPMGMLLVSVEGKFLRVNKKFAQITGYSGEELLGMTFGNITHPDDIEEGRFFVKDALQGKLSTYFTEKRYIHKNGNIIWANLSSSVVTDAINQVQYFVTQVEDITEKRESELKFKNLLERSLVGIYIQKEGKQFKYVNPRMTEIFGYTEQELLELPAELVIHEEDLSIVREVNRQRFEGNVTTHYEVRGKRKDGTTIWLDIYGSLIEHNGEAAVLGNIQDITIRKIAEAELKKINHDIGERVKELNCLYRLSEISNKPETSMNDIIGQFIEIIPSSYQYPEVTCARIILNNKSFTTSFFKESIWKQEAIIVANNINIGNVEVFYIEAMPDEQEGPFLKEERFLINSIAEILGNTAERKKTGAELRESEEKFRSIVEQSLVGIYIIQNGKLVYVNPGFEKIFGYSKNEMINKMSFEGLVHEDDIELVKSYYDRRISKRKTKQQYTFRAIRNDGAILYIEVIASMILYNDEPAIIGTLVDITDRIEEERRMNQAVLDAQEKERLQIGMELHDNVKQILAGSGLFLDIARNKLDDKEAVIEILDNLKKYNKEAIDELRRLSHQLAPSVDSDTSLDDKIAWLIRSLKIDEKLSVSVHIDEFEKPLNNNTQLTFYRILQEQLSNILKYAGASAVEIDIRSVDDEIHLQISDNGKGFDISTKKEGIGLENIRRRVQMLNGKVEIITSPGKGCEVIVQVPVALT